MAKIIEGRVSDFTPDKRNANKGTLRGLAQLDDSIRQSGAGRSLLADKHGNLIAGNKTAERAIDAGLDNAIIVQTTGDEVVIVQRTDLDLNTAAGRKMAYADNRISQTDLDFSPEQMIADLQDGLFPDGLWYDWELENLIAASQQPIDPNAEWQGMPEYEHDDLTAFQSVHIHFANPEAAQDFATLIGQPITEHTRSLWFPKQETIRYGQARES